jgi:diadenosine tetraphosphate (Ap4A) HIT family hydrolase
MAGLSGPTWLTTRTPSEEDGVWEHSIGVLDAKELTMPYGIPDRFPCPFCESRLGRLEYVSCGESMAAIAEVSDCERSPGGGAVLVWPKRHVEKISQLTDFEARDIANLLHQASSAVIGALKPEAFHTFCSAGSLVGQSEAHMHFQIQPRYRGREYSFKSARDLPTVKLSDRRSIAASLMEHTIENGAEKAPQSLVFGDSKDILKELSASDLEDLTISDSPNFLSICHPSSRGTESVLILSKSDARTYVDLEQNEREELFMLIRDIARAAEELFDPDGLSIWWESGCDAGQMGKRLAVEIVPRFHGKTYVYKDREHLARVHKIQLVVAARKYREGLVLSIKDTVVSE